MRTRKVQIDEDVYTIGALTLEQVEKFIAPMEKLGDEDAKIRAYELVCYGLNNANKKNGAEKDKWTKERVYTELDMVSFMRLQDEILELSGLRAKDKSLGEAETVTVLTSQPSGVV